MCSPAKVKPPPFMVIPQAVPVMVTVLPDDGARVIPVFSVSVPAIEKFAPDCDEGVVATVKLLNVRVPELFVIPHPVPVIVIVSSGANVTPLFIVNVPAIEKLAFGCTEGVPAMARPLKVSVPALEMSQSVPDMVAVPLVGAKVAPAPTARVPATEKLEEVVTVAPAAMVKLLNAPAVIELPSTIVMVSIDERSWPFSGPAIERSEGDAVNPFNALVVSP